MSDEKNLEKYTIEENGEDTDQSIKNDTGLTERVVSTPEEEKMKELIEQLEKQTGKIGSSENKAPTKVSRDDEYDDYDEDEEDDDDYRPRRHHFLKLTALILAFGVGAFFARELYASYMAPKRDVTTVGDASDTSIHYDPVGVKLDDRGNVAGTDGKVSTEAVTEQATTDSDDYDAYYAKFYEKFYGELTDAEKEAGGDSVNVDSSSSNVVLTSGAVQDGSWYNAAKYKGLGTSSITYFDDAIFLGDSRTHGMIMYNDSVKGYAKDGYTCARSCQSADFEVNGYMVTMLDAVRYDHASAYYVAFGTNELYYDDANRFVQEEKVLIDAIKEANPDATVYVLNILPISAGFESSNPSFTNARAAEYNMALRNMCRNYGDVIYLDQASVMLDPATGKAKEGATGDGLHYGPDGCKQIFSYISSHVASKK